MSEQPCLSEFQPPESCHYRYRTSDLHQMKPKKDNRVANSCKCVH